MWKQTAYAVLLVLLVLISYLYVYPWLDAGRQAVRYLNACILADLCPSGETISAHLAMKTNPPIQTEPPPKK